MAANDARFRHLPFLDGVRAVAIVMVMAWHARSPHTARYADRFQVWLGVDAFFVLSGFLITSLLVQERFDHGSFSLKDFYARRALRIFPAYFVFLGAMLLYFGEPARRPIALAAVYLNNYDHGLKWGYYGGFPGGDGFHAIGPVWSLCIEEQFYLLWPLTLSFIGRGDDRNPTKTPRALKFTLAVVAAIMLWKVALLLHDPQINDGRIYYPFETRADSVLIGCAAALAWAHPATRERIRAGLSSSWTPAILVVALASAVQTVRTTEVKWLWNRIESWAIMLPIFSSLVALLILSLIVQPGAALAKIMSHRALGWIGRLSYSIYLWHAFSIEETKKLGAKLAERAPDLAPGAVELLTVASGVVGSVALACLSYYVVEKPFLRLKRRFQAAPAKPDPPTAP